MAPYNRVIGGRRRPKPTLSSVDLADDAALDGQVADSTPDPFDPPYEAHRLRVAGVPWVEVARRTGYASPESAAMAVSLYLQKAAAMMSAEHQREALQTEVDRYETLLKEWWADGTIGRDPAAATILLKTLAQLDRVQRLTDGDVITTRETLVISPDPDTYVKQLQQVVADRRPG